MTHSSWNEAIAAIRLSTGLRTDRQLALARMAHVELPPELPQIVAGARLQEALAPELHISPTGEPFASQIELLGVLSDFAPKNMKVDPSNGREANAWLEWLWLESRAAALEALQLQAGDIVEVASKEGGLAEVSSIGSDGRIYFRGGMGRGAWPDQVLVRARRSDNTVDARALRQAAANQRAERAKLTHWSLSKHGEIAQYEVDTPLSVHDIELLRLALATAEDERPIQKLVESHPQLLTSLIGGSPRYCIPQVRLGAEFIPDFIVGSVDSIGIRWLLVELETPQSEVTLLNDNQLDQYGRKGVSQIESWREWLIQNLDYARRSRRNHGLGLPDLRPANDGLVIVGRRARLRANTHTVRAPIEEMRRIRVHTYDWWLEQLQGIVEYSGPWASNRYLLHRSDDELSSW